MGLEVCELTKSYAGKKVLNRVSFSIADGKGLCVMGASGCGKTTLFRIVMGLENADEGDVRGARHGAVAAVFQEDRLLENLSAVKNVWLVCKKMADEAGIRRELSEILPSEALDKPIKQLSGGMKRRVALVRAMRRESDLVVMDEPFTGLDEETKKNVIRYLKERLRGKTFLFSSHQEEDARLLGTEIYRLDAANDRKEKKI